MYDENGGKMAKIDTQFMTKRAEKPTLWGRTYLYSPYKGVPTGEGYCEEYITDKLPIHH